MMNLKEGQLFVDILNQHVEAKNDRTGIISVHCVIRINRYG